MSQARLEREVRSSSRFAGVTRVGFRVVIVAGFAGAAWAMSASAASAATDLSSVVTATDPAGAPLTSSVLALVDNVGSGMLGSGSSADSIAESVLTPVSETVEPLLSAGGGVLSQVLAPTNTVLSHIGTDSTAHAGTSHASGPRSAAVTATPDDALDSAANQATSGASERPHGVELSDEAGTRSPDLLRTAALLVAPLGLDQILQPAIDVLQPLVGVIDPLTAPFDQLLRPVTGVVDDVTTPIFDALGSVVGPLDGVVAHSADGSPVETVPDAAAPMPSVSAIQPGTATMIEADSVRVDAASSAKRGIDRHGTRGAPVRRTHPTGSDRHNIPASPAPMPALPAPSLGGISTAASGSHGGKDGVAIVSVPVRGGVAAARRIAQSTGFAVRRLLVENPTVSPD